ncbi:hypothetical protein [Sphingomonas aracearum]|uniref:Uncharacterized protein n=1 Tax=Sphingomonas aracearum TaxID=2283317 RepID=A0A369VVA9_9SPHN|nr:hypothetical protein [Sphingomonas aracearum]RDE05110.1 hypothetical protein DVW87_07445 [Sphingomonas aracearum]
MADTNNSGNETPPTGTEFSPAAPLDTMEVEFDSAAGGPQANKSEETGSTAGGTTAGTAKQAFSDASQKLTAFTGDKARAYAEDGKAKAGSLLDDFARLLQDAAGNVDGKLGEQYGNYARSAASTVSDFSGKVKNKDLDELVAEARGFVEKSPAVAIGTAAALGFVLMRVVKAGIDANKTDA